MHEKAGFKNVWIILLLGLIVGCSSTEVRRLPSNPDPLIRGEMTEDKARRALEMKLTKQMKFLEENGERFKKQVVALPSGDIKYHYKYYDEFPGGPENLSVTITPLEALPLPYKGEVKYRKVRYQTRYTTSQRKAVNDNDFIRDEGVQKETHEFDGTKWELKSSIFEVRKTSVYDKDRWTASRGRIRRIEDEQPELFVDKLQNLFGLLD
jgi:hypothetical protein